MIQVHGGPASVVAPIHFINARSVAVRSFPQSPSPNPSSSLKRIPMRFPAALYPFSLLLLASCTQERESAPTAPESTPLFNGSNLDGWSHVLVEDIPMDQVWSVADGMIICKGQPFGYLRTEESYQDFTLTFDWRWAPGQNPGNSGVLLRIAGEPKGFMPKCVEAQLQHGSAGDIWAFFGAGLNAEGDRAREVTAHETLGDFQGIGKIEGAEHPAGDWNTYEITLAGDSLTLKVNGKLVNSAKGLDVVSGPIGLQSEGAEIHFRNLNILVHK